jgi:hypothetical protein
MANTGFDNQGAGSTLVNNALSNVAGILSSRPNAKYLSGARVVLKINGKLVGFAFGISWNITTSYTEVMTCDDYLPYELSPRRVSVDGTISCLHIPGTSATTEAWQGDVLSFLFQPYISIEARDSATNQIIFATDKAVIEQRSEDIRVDQLSSVTLRWRAIGFVDEKDLSTLSPPNDYNQSSDTATPTTQGNPVTNAIASVANAVSGAVGGTP